MDLRETKSIEKESIFRHPWELARLDVIYNIFNQNISEIENSTIIDIGCGDTFFVEKFSERFPTVNFIAVDTAFDDQTINLYLSKLKGKKISLFSSLEDARKNITSNVSAIFLFDVIEHIEDDYSFLNNLSSQKFVSPKTKFFITVPAFQSLFTSHDLFLGHYRRYTNSSLRKLINKSGFSEIEIGYFFLSLIPPRILQLMKEKIIGKPKQATTDLVEWKGGRITTSLLKTILIFDFKISSSLKKKGINSIGLSNYIVCKKSV